MNSINNNPTTPHFREIFTLKTLKEEDPLAYYAMLEEAMQNYNTVKAQPDATAYAFDEELGHLFTAWKKNNNKS